MNTYKKLNNDIYARLSSLPPQEVIKEFGIKLFIVSSLSPRGRFKRLTFLAHHIFTIGVLFVLLLIASLLGGLFGYILGAEIGNYIFGGLYFIMIFPGFVALLFHQVKRLHDFGVSGVIIILCFLIHFGLLAYGDETGEVISALLSMVYISVLVFMPSGKDNRYGPNIKSIMKSKPLTENKVNIDVNYKNSLKILYVTLIVLLVFVVAALGYQKISENNDNKSNAIQSPDTPIEYEEDLSWLHDGAKLNLKTIYREGKLLFQLVIEDYINLREYNKNRSITLDFKDRNSFKVASYQINISDLITGNGSNGYYSYNGEIGLSYENYLLKESIDIVTTLNPDYTAKKADELEKLFILFRGDNLKLSGFNKILNDLINIGANKNYVDILANDTRVAKVYNQTIDYSIYRILKQEGREIQSNYDEKLVSTISKFQKHWNQRNSENKIRTDGIINTSTIEKMILSLEPLIEKSIMEEDSDVSYNNTTGEQLIREYYYLIKEGSLQEAYSISVKKSSYETFYDWFKDVTDIEIHFVESMGNEWYNIQVTISENSGEVTRYSTKSRVGLDENGEKRILETQINKM